MFDLDRIVVLPNEVVLKSSVERVSLPKRIKFVFGGEEVVPEIFKVIIADFDSICDHRVCRDFWYSIDGYDNLYACHNGVVYHIVADYEFESDDSINDRTSKAISDLYGLTDEYVDTLKLFKVDVEGLPETIILQ